MGFIAWHSFWGLGGNSIANRGDASHIHHLLSSLPLPCQAANDPVQPRESKRGKVLFRGVAPCWFWVIIVNNIYNMLINVNKHNTKHCFVTKTVLLRFDSISTVYIQTYIYIYTVNIYLHLHIYTVWVIVSGKVVDNNLVHILILRVWHLKTLSNNSDCAMI